VGVKNGGVTSYVTRIVKPVSRIVGDAVTPGTQVEFRWRSSSSAYHNPRETKLAVTYQLMFGPQVGVDGKVQGDITDGATNDAVVGAQLPSNVRFTACPNTCLFGDGAQYQVNSTMIENQVNYYQAAMVKLYTKYDSQADTSGSCGLINRRKDMHAPTLNNAFYPAAADAQGDGATREDTHEFSEKYNCKQELLRQSFTPTAQKSGEIEIFDNIWLSSFEHGYFVAGADHTLTLNVTQHFEDMFNSQTLSFANEDATGEVDSFTQRAYDKIVVGKLPAANATEQGTIYVEVKDISLHVAMAGTVPSIPPSVALKFSELMITNRELTQQQNELSLVVPPSTRAIYAFSRQLIHDVRADAEELGLAGAGIDEVGLCKDTNQAGNTATMPATITSLLFELGGQVQPSSGGYTNMDITQFRAGRAFTDALSVVGKPSAMRGTTWDFIDWCGKKSVNGRSFPDGATGRRGTGEQRTQTVGGQLFGDQGPGYFVRMILPPNSLSNVLTVRCNLDADPGQDAKQQLTIVAVHDSLWTMQYAPPAELPIETKVSPIT
jgi:hypothetical protein